MLHRKFSTNSNTMLVQRLFCNSIRSFSSSTPIVLKNGHVLKLGRTFSGADVTEHSKLTFDTNPLHFDSECAKIAGFDDRIVPGMLVASLFPRIIASHFFKLPVYIGEEIISEVQATNVREMKHKYLAKFTTKCFKDDGVLVIDGEATAILPTLNIHHV